MNAVFSMFSLFVATLVLVGLLGSGFVLIGMDQVWFGAACAGMAFPCFHFVFKGLRKYLGF